MRSGSGTIARSGRPLRIPLVLPLAIVGLSICLLVYMWAADLLIAGAAFAAFCMLLVVALFLLQPSRLLLVFLWLLPIYQLSLVLLYDITGSNLIITAVQPWKEALALLTLLLVAGYYTLFVRKMRIYALDGVMLVYLGLALIYTLLPWESKPIVRLYGFRSLSFLVIIYLLGRSVPLSTRRQTQVVYSLLLIGLLTGIATLIDRFVLPIDWPARIGLGNYLARVASTEDLAKMIGPLGLPWTYWTASIERRASAFFANPLDLAASVHLTGVTALVVACHSRRFSRRGLLAWSVFALTGLALLLSISRMSIVIFAVECLLVVILLRRKNLTMLFVAAMVLGGAGLMLTGYRDFIVETITLQNPSALGHVEEWQRGFSALFSYPLGLGPGTSGLIGARFGTQVGGENQYVTVGVQLGIAGLLLYIGIQAAAVYTALQVFRRSTGVTRVLALVTGVSRLGLAAVAFTADLETYVFSAFVSWWLVGWVCQVAAGQKQLRAPLETGPSQAKQQETRPGE